MHDLVGHACMYLYLSRCIFVVVAALLLSFIRDRWSKLRDVTLVSEVGYELNSEGQRHREKMRGII